MSKSNKLEKSTPEEKIQLQKKTLDTHFTTNDNETKRQKVKFIAKIKYPEYFEQEKPLEQLGNNTANVSWH